MNNSSSVKDNQRHPVITSTAFSPHRTALLESALPVSVTAVSSGDSALPRAMFPCFFHTSKCVRFAFLDGVDPDTQVDYSHRRLWLTEHLSLLIRVFCIDVVGLKIEPHQYHLVLSPDARAAQILSRHEVICRWRQLYRGPKAMDHYVNGNVLSHGDRDMVATTAENWRGFLTDTSRFLGHLHQTISLRANEEEGCRGRFWEGRARCQVIRCQAELDALLVQLDGLG